MPSKQEVLKTIEDRTYYGKEVRHLITSISKTPTLSFPITTVRKGDVFTYDRIDKTRPCVVIKVIKDICIALSMSTTKNWMNLGKFKCRQFGENYFNMNMFLVESSYVRKHFLGIMSYRKGLNESIKLLKYLTDKV